MIGAGTMGAGIAVALLDAGIPTSLVETDQAALDRGLARIAAIYDGQVKKGRISESERDRRLSRLRPTLDYEAIATSDVVIEAVFESMPVKREVFHALDRVMKPGAILATNTSTLDVDAIAAFTRRPSDVLGLHFFSPANVMRLLEVVRGRETSPEVLATGLALAKKLRKVAVVAGRVRRIHRQPDARRLRPGRRSGWSKRARAPSRWTGRWRSSGWRWGRSGSVTWSDSTSARRFGEHRRRTRPDYQCSTLPDRLVAIGRLGQKTGGGWYDYPEGPRKAVPSPAAGELIALRTARSSASRRVRSTTARSSAAWCRARVRGARLLAEGIAARASDIDVVYLTGYGFPRARGGPMFYTDQTVLAG